MEPLRFDSTQREASAAQIRVVESNGESNGMTEEERKERTAREQEENTARVAAFRATQQKFQREREEYFTSTIEDARKTHRPSLWP